MIAFCTTCKNRTDHLRQTLPVSLAGNPNSKFVVLDYNTQDDLHEFLKLFPLEMALGRLVVYSYEGYPKFRMAHAKNMAHRLGVLEGADVLVNLDADNYAGHGFETFATEKFQEPRVYLWGKMVKGEMVRGISGRIAVEPKAFFKLGGYDERQYNEWGNDDKDFNIRLESSGYKPIEIDKKFLSGIHHSNKRRFREYPEVGKNLEKYGEPCVVVERTVINEGRIGCGTVYKNFERDDVIELKPIPARIFGVGLPKTGTVSLHRAFQRLGYDSWHWETARQAKEIWEQISFAGGSFTLEQHEALSDLPIPILYQELDRAYPGSKFVLTIRNEEKWIHSVQKHFDYEHNRWRSSWDDDCFSHRIHKLTFGQTYFSRDVFLNRYREHNANVQEYFKHRPESLLVLRLDRGDGWEKLCAFLGKDVPNEPFPRENKTI